MRIDRSTYQSWMEELDLQREIHREISLREAAQSAACFPLDALAIEAMSSFYFAVAPEGDEASWDVPFTEAEVEAQFEAIDEAIEAVDRCTKELTGGGGSDQADPIHPEGQTASSGASGLAVGVALGGLGLAALGAYFLVRKR